jgi:hypothetical protein
MGCQAPKADASVSDCWWASQGLGVASRSTIFTYDEIEQMIENSGRQITLSVSSSFEVMFKFFKKEG